MGRWSLHPGWDVDKNATETIVEEIIEEVISEVEEVIDFNPEAAATDGNPFPEELATADTTDYESMTVACIDSQRYQGGTHRPPGSR